MVWIPSQAEKWGGNYRPEKQLMDFREVLDHCQLHDLGFTGGLFTWCNRRESLDTISERLDRFLSINAWKRTTQFWHVSHSFAASSGHIPIILVTTNEI